MFQAWALLQNHNVRVCIEKKHRFPTVHTNWYPVLSFWTKPLIWSTVSFKNLQTLFKQRYFFYVHKQQTRSRKQCICTSEGSFFPQSVTSTLQLPLQNGRSLYTTRSLPKSSRCHLKLKSENRHSTSNFQDSEGLGLTVITRPPSLLFRQTPPIDAFLCTNPPATPEVKDQVATLEMRHRLTTRNPITAELMNSFTEDAFNQRTPSQRTLVVEWVRRWEKQDQKSAPHSNQDSCALPTLCSFWPPKKLRKTNPILFLRLWASSKSSPWLSGSALIWKDSQRSEKKPPHFHKQVRLCFFFKEKNERQRW